jgi:hypothetical protein
MNIKDNITRYTNLEENDSLSGFMGHVAQQSHNAYQVFYNFLAKVRPKRILEIGTSLGGFTTFLKICCDELGLATNIRSYDINSYPWYKDIIKKGIDIRVENIFNENYESCDQEVINYINQDGLTVVLCDGGSKIREFNLFAKHIKPGDYILAHDYTSTQEKYEQDIKNKIWNWCEITDKDIEQSSNENNLEFYNQDAFNTAVWVCKRKKSSNENITEVKSADKQATEKIVNSVNSQPSRDKKNVTIVTGIWNLKRDQAGDGFKRPFQHYIDNFIKLLKTDANMVIFIEKEQEDLVWQYRDKKNTAVVIRSTDRFINEFPFYKKIQELRNDPAWYNQAGWLKNSTQGSLELYNPMVMSKYFMLHDAVCHNFFDTDYYIWIDGGITNTVHEGYFTHDKVLDKIEPYLDRMLFLSFPYIGSEEIHGFARTGMNKYANTDYVKYVCRGGVFGGHKNYIRKYNGIYYNLLQSTLNENYMGTEESIFTIMAHLYPEDMSRYVLEDNGLVSKFFEDLKNNTVELVKNKRRTEIHDPKTSLYVLTFNSPDQFQFLVESYLKHSKFVSKTTNYLINNSTDLSTTEKYLQLCEKYNFQHIKKDNLGICGGRQFVAEHFDASDSDFYIFLEDDMNLMPENTEKCTSGFSRYTPNLFDKCVHIINHENYDFLKLSFTEFYGNNSTQWSWYNVPQTAREEYFPDNLKLPVMGLDPNAPKTLFKNIKIYQDLAYADGDIYYCNWPQFVSRSGNKKMFLDVKWAHPYEQTWMSHIFQQTKKGIIRGSLLLLSPINHHRFHHYDGKERKES